MAIYYQIPSKTLAINLGNKNSVQFRMPPSFHFQPQQKRSSSQEGEEPGEWGIGHQHPFPRGGHQLHEAQSAKNPQET